MQIAKGGIDQDQTEHGDTERRSDPRPPFCFLEVAEAAERKIVIELTAFCHHRGEDGSKKREGFVAPVAGAGLGNHEVVDPECDADRGENIAAFVERINVFRRKCIAIPESQDIFVIAVLVDIAERTVRAVAKPVCPGRLFGIHDGAIEHEFVAELTNRLSIHRVVQHFVQDFADLAVGLSLIFDEIDQERLARIKAHLDVRLIEVLVGVKPERLQACAVPSGVNGSCGE